MDVQTGVNILLVFIGCVIFVESRRFLSRASDETNKKLSSPMLQWIYGTSTAVVILIVFFGLSVIIDVTSLLRPFVFAISWAFGFGLVSPLLYYLFSRSTKS